MTVTPTRPVSVDELRRAYLALAAGDFRLGRSRQEPSAAWSQQGRVLAVVGASPASGASTLALALATVAGSARVLECASTATAGLAAASTAELGADHRGWRPASRGPIVIERPSRPARDPEQVPTPKVTEPGMVVVDVAWDLELALTGNGWLGCLLRRTDPVVVTAVPTVPGIRRLEAALDRLGHTQRVVALLAPARGRTPRPITRALEELQRSHQMSGRVVHIPTDPRLLTHGPDSTPLPRSVVHAAAQVLQIALERKDHP